MKINNISRIVILLALVANVITGCRFEEEDLFDTSANLRQEYANREIKKILCSASENGGHGWVFQYFVAGNDDEKFPGFNLFSKFYDSGKVIIGGDHAYMKGGLEGVYMESASFYEMKKDEANTLAFTTWNNVLTPFVNPDASGEGMHGDCDLVVMSWDENEITFRGTRHSARSRLVRLDRPVDQYIAEVQDMKSRFVNNESNPFTITNPGSKVAYLVDVTSGRVQMRDRVLDPLSISERALVFTPDGFHLETPCSSFEDDFKFQDFVYDQAKDVFVESSDNNIVLDVAFVKPVDFFYNTMQAGRTWAFSETSEMSADYQSLFSDIVSASSNLKNHQFLLKYSKSKDVMEVTFKYKISSKFYQTVYSYNVEKTDNSIRFSNPTLSSSKAYEGVSPAATKTKVQNAVEAMINKLACDASFADTTTKWARNSVKMGNSSMDSYVILK